MPEGAQEAEFGAFATAAACRVGHASRAGEKPRITPSPTTRFLNGGEVNLDLSQRRPSRATCLRPSEHGMGRTAGEWLAAHAAKTRAVRVPAGTALAEPIVVHAHGKNAAASVASLDVVVEEGASAQVLVCFDAPGGRRGRHRLHARRICRCRRARRHPNRACRQRRLYHHGRHCAVPRRRRTHHRAPHRARLRQIVCGPGRQPVEQSAPTCT